MFWEPVRVGQSAEVVENGLFGGAGNCFFLVDDFKDERRLGSLKLNLIKFLVAWKETNDPRQMSWR